MSERTCLHQRCSFGICLPARHVLWRVRWEKANHLITENSENNLYRVAVEFSETFSLTQRCNNVVEEIFFLFAINARLFAVSLFTLTTNPSILFTTSNCFEVTSIWLFIILFPLNILMQDTKILN